MTEQITGTPIVEGVHPVDDTVPVAVQVRLVARGLHSVQDTVVVVVKVEAVAHTVQIGIETFYLVGPRFATAVHALSSPRWSRP